jgi:hypothetical protein
MVGITVMASPVHARCMSFVQRMKRNVAIPSSALHKSFIFHERGYRNTRTHIKGLFFLRTWMKSFWNNLTRKRISSHSSPEVFILPSLYNHGLQTPPILLDSFFVVRFTTLPVARTKRSRILWGITTWKEFYKETSLRYYQGNRLETE